MLRDYVSRELPVDPGDEVTSDLTESDWAWVRSGDGKKGWVPLGCLQEVAEQETGMAKSDQDIVIRPIDGEVEIENCARIMVDSEP
jgi:hypothetical protein